MDDDASICEGLSNLLEALGVAAQHFHRPRHFASTGIVPAQAACCWTRGFPGISGVEFQEQMRQSGIDIPIIFMTAHGDIPMVRKVMKAGAIEFLTKPFQKEELLHAVEQAFLFDRAKRREDAI